MVGDWPWVVLMGAREGIGDVTISCRVKSDFSGDVTDTVTDTL